MSDAKLEKGLDHLDQAIFDWRDAAAAFEPYLAELRLRNSPELLAIERSLVNMAEAVTRLRIATSAALVQR